MNADESISRSFGERRKRSNFDVRPEEVSQVNQSALANILQSSAITKAILDEENNVSQVYISVTPIEYQRKLDNAMEKNFRYLERKDLIAMEILMYGRPISIPLPTTNNSRKVSRFEINHNVHTINHSGLGSLEAPAPQATTITATTNNTAIQNVCSIYVNNLPKDITQEELEILFGAQDKKIKKMKIYTDPGTNKQKGDALITYYKPEHATSACLKLNKLDIGDGYIIEVTKAKFQNNNNSSNSNKATESETNRIFDTNGELLWKLLQEESCSIDYPVLLINNAIDIALASNDDQFVHHLGIIESEILVDCCTFGNLKYLHIFNQDDSALFGCIAVTFEDVDAARDCAAAFQSKPYNNRILRTKVFLPPNTCAQQKPSSPEVMNIDTPINVSEVVSNDEVMEEPIIESTDKDLTAEQQAAVEDVEDFLNSLL